jgi:cold shock CspA family protein
MGFLTTAGGQEIFVAASAISGSCNGTLREGQAVEFEILVVKQGTPAVEKRTAKDVTCR